MRQTAPGERIGVLVPYKYLEDIAFADEAFEATGDTPAELSGERLNPARHDLRVDVKAVTMHRFSVEERNSRWRAVVVLDV